MTNEEIIDKHTPKSPEYVTMNRRYRCTVKHIDSMIDEARKDEAEKIMADVRNKMGPFQTIIDLLDEAYITFEKERVHTLFWEAISICKDNIQLFKKQR